ncbi:UNVERIFIED_CONTAM: hypothetical protein K2H54_027351 [Gekko kuhli]
MTHKHINKGNAGCPFPSNTGGGFGLSIQQEEEGPPRAVELSNQAQGKRQDQSMFAEVAAELSSQHRGSNQHHAQAASGLNLHNQFFFPLAQSLGYGVEHLFLFNLSDKKSLLPFNVQGQGPEADSRSDLTLG